MRGGRVAYGPCSPARESASLRASEATLAENGEGAASLCSRPVSLSLLYSVHIFRALKRARGSRSSSPYPRHAWPVRKAEPADRAVLDSILGKLPEPPLHCVFAALEEHCCCCLVSYRVGFVAVAEQVDLVSAAVHPVPFPRRHQAVVDGSQLHYLEASEFTVTLRSARCVSRH